nr:sulfatase-like hydrolase/transferase [Acetatifactor sp.]
AYIACHIELDKALEYILQQLEEAGKLENTVIVMSADHYPYAMTTEEYEELAGKSLSYGKDVFRNNLILWNVAFEDEPVIVNKPCCSVDILPTLLNLLGMDYDSRMYAGKDIFCDEEGMVIFNDRSFVTDGVIYNRKTKETLWQKDMTGEYVVPAAQQEDYLKQKQQEVKDIYQFSAYVLQENYYTDIEAARVAQ